MVGKTIRGKAHYHCLTSVYRSNRPGDPRFHTDCGFNCVSHDEVLELLTRKLDRLKLEVEEAIEQGGLKLLEEEIRQHEALARRAAEEGCREYLAGLWADLDLGTTPSSSLARLVFPYLSESPSVEVLERIEAAKVLYARQQIEQLQEDHRHMTLALARPGTSERQKQVLETECRRIEGRLTVLEKHLSPLQEQQERLQQEYQELLDRREEALKALKHGENRAKGAALAKVFAKVLLRFGWMNEGHKGRGRHGRIISVWQPENTSFVFTVEGLVSWLGANGHLEGENLHRGLHALGTHVIYDRFREESNSAAASSR
jgi:hypothetical protein